MAGQQRQPWRVAVVRDEPVDGPLAAALRRHGLIPAACPVLLAAPPADPGPLQRAAGRLAEYDWVIAASARAVIALSQVLPGSVPAATRTAAVGVATARALETLGPSRAPVVANRAGAEALLDRLAATDTWPERRVLVLTTPGGMTTLPDGLRAAGARVEVVEAYRMVPRSADEIRRAWAAADADAAAIGSARAATTLVEAVGRKALLRLSGVVAMGETTARALHTCGVTADVPEYASFEGVADTVVRLQAARSGAAAGRAPAGQGPA